MITIGHHLRMIASLLVVFVFLLIVNLSLEKAVNIMLFHDQVLSSSIGKLH